jgi:RNA polymerase sigma factor (sigma-70 family)
MNGDAELLSRYAAERSEAAFAELTRRHLDLVYSAALRMMNGDAHSAQDITQQVFTELAALAPRLSRHPALVGWLYTATRRMALRAHRTERRRKAREQEAQTMHELLQDDSPAADWSRLSPVIEDAVHELCEKDRIAILLRFFQNKSFQEVGAELSLTENAARMRLDRAVDKLRRKLVRRSITTTTAGLAAVVPANAVHMAPAGLAASVSAVAMAGCALDASSLFAITKTITMTTMQKTIAATTLAVAVGTGIYAVRQASQLRERLQTLQQKQAPLVAQVQELQQQRGQLTNQLAALREENVRLQSGQRTSEVLKLRGQVGALRQSLSSAAEPPSVGTAKLMNDSSMRDYLRQSQLRAFRTLYGPLMEELNLSAENTEKLTQTMSDTSLKAAGTILAMTQTNAPLTDMRKAVEDAKGEMDNQLRLMLGEAGYNQYTAYRQQLPAQATVSALNAELGDKTLDAEQRARLLQIVNAEPYTATHGAFGELDVVFFGSRQEIEAYLAEVADSNQRILNQAASFLGPEQLATLAKVQSNSITAQRVQGNILAQKH